MAYIFGLTPAAPGYQRPRIEPLRSLLSCAKGSFTAALGNLSIEWSEEQGILLSSTADIDVKVVVHGFMENYYLISSQVYSF